MDYLMNYSAQLLQYVLTIGIKDIIDIGLLSVLFYKLIMLARRTSSSGVLRGIVLILLAVALASRLHLNALSFLLNRLVEMGFFALIVVFQPEIRHFLEQVGRSSIYDIFGKKAGGAAEEEAIAQTVRAYTALSRDKVGALMVFERRNRLDEYLKSGTEMDSSINEQLLKNLFWNKAPLHDGAVIVRDGRIIGAGCMLPMSANVNLSPDLGMRHRAGIGVSEHSDAVVAIVSEETGAISVAVGGMLKRHLAPETLERVLRNELLPQENRQEEDSVGQAILRFFGLGKGQKQDG